MPFGRRSQQVAVPADARDWRPQQPAGSVRSLRHPLIEPFWDGIPVIAHFSDHVAVFIDDHGVDRTEEFADEAVELAAAVDADEAIIHGVLTARPIQPGGDRLGLPDIPGMSDHAKQMLMGERQPDRVALPKPQLGEEINFIALDLLSIDNQLLLEVPLLERKRLLESAVTTVGHIAVTPFSQPPGTTFRTSCRAMGFWALVYKASNSRYIPGQRSEDWAVFRIPSR